MEDLNKCILRVLDAPMRVAHTSVDGKGIGTEESHMLSFRRTAAAVDALVTASEATLFGVREGCWLYVFRRRNDKAAADAYMNRLTATTVTEYAFDMQEVEEADRDRGTVLYCYRYRFGVLQPVHRRGSTQEPDMLSDWTVE